MSKRTARACAAASLVCIIAGCAGPQRDHAHDAQTERSTHASRIRTSAASAEFERSAPARIDRQWMERELAREVLHVLEPHLGQMGLDTPQGRELVARIVPAAMSERMRVDERVGERTMLFVRETDAPEFREVKKWLDEVYGEATSRAFTTPGGSWPVKSGVVGPIPEDPVLRVMLALQVDWLGVYANYVEDPNPKPPTIKGAGASPAQQVAQRATPRKAPMDGAETPEKLAEIAATIASCREKSAAVISEALARAAASPAFAGERIQILGFVVLRLSDRNFDRPTHLRAAELYAARPDADPWLASLYRGIVLLEMAWDARGDAFAAETSEAQFARFHEGLKACYAPLKQAYNLAPKRPHPLGPLISQAMGTNNPAHEPGEQWFAAAIAIDPTWIDAYARMTSVVLDRWGGDDQDRVSLLRRMHEASRHEGGGAVAMLAPSLLARALEDNPGMQRDARWSLEYQACLQPLWINSTPETGVFTGVDPDEAWSMALVCAIMAGDVLTTWAVMDEPGHRFIPSDSEAFAMSWAEVEQWAMARHPTDGKAYREMTSALFASNIDKAAAIAAELAKATKSPRMAEAANRVLTLKRFDERLDAGETIDLLDASTRLMWQGSEPVLAASTRAAAGLSMGQVVLASGDDGEIRFPLELRGRVRIEMDVELPEREPGKPAGARLTVGLVNPRANSGANQGPLPFKVFIFDSSIQSMMGDRSGRYRQSLPPAVSGVRHTIVLDADGPRGALIVDGKVWDVYEPSPTLGKGKPPTAIEGVLSVSAMLATPESRIRIDSIKVSRPTEALAERSIDGGGATP